MEIINLLNYKETRFNTAIALGNFDGFHVGHQKLIKTMISKSKELGLKSSLLLFENHTKAMTDSNKPKMITTNQQKFKIAEELGIDMIYIIDFDEKLMKLSSEGFVRDIIIEKMNGKSVVVGFDYKFGYKASGNSQYLLELGKKYDIDVKVLDPIYDKDNIISSTIVRELIMDGDMNRANEMLGRSYSIVGKVIPGRNRGNKLGFPTANMAAYNNYVIPKIGVYASNVIINGKRYLSATNIGYNPTFDEDTLKIETHILDFKEDIYEEIIEVEFIDYLRGDIRFNNKEDLIHQMENDIELIKKRY